MRTPAGLSPTLRTPSSTREGRDLKVKGISSMWFEISDVGREKLLICQFYREFKVLKEGEDSRAMSEQLRRSKVLMERIADSSTTFEVITMGDANADHYDPTEGPFVEQVVDVLEGAGLCQTVRKPTRWIRGSKQSRIDHSWNNLVSKHIKTKNIETSSDHCCVVSLFQRKKLTSAQPQLWRSWRQFEENNFWFHLGRKCWDDIYLQSNLSLVYDMIRSNISSHS